MATSIQPPRGIGTGGWLSMAPQMDDGPSVARQPVAKIEQRYDSNAASPALTGSIVASPIVPPARKGDAQPEGLAKLPSLLKAQASNRVPDLVPSPPPLPTTSSPSETQKPTFQPVPRTKARFSVGDTGSHLGSPDIPTPPSPTYSDRSGDGDHSPPPFDVRNSFAPMRWGQPGPVISSRRESETQDGQSGNRVTQQNNSIYDTSSTSAVVDGAEDIEMDAEEEDEPQFTLGGRKFKGKTAHAIELEMEALGDRTVMSYAPDAVYLASRLEGLRRNLEAGGTRFQRRWWEDLEEAHETENFSDVAARPTTPSLPSVATPAATLEDTAMLTSASSKIATGIHSPKSAAVSLQDDKDAIAATHDVTGSPKRNAIDPMARQAALDARVEIRTLRRPDLEQVRELHCYHGDGDKVDTDTYTTSAAFLLRLLVDEHYVCLVAVAKPLPEPPTLPNASAPRPPPPSLDMPASRSPFLLASGNGSAASRKRPTSNLSRSLFPVPHPDLLANATPAPRSFGAGPDSSENTSSLYDSDEEDKMRQDSLFERAKAASTYVTGDTSPPLGERGDEEDDDDEMSDIAEEDEKALQSDVGQGTAHVVGGFDSSPRATPSRRTSSSMHSRHGVLAGPTFDVAPPRAIRVMGAPPLGRMPLESEAILGVVSARIKVVQRTVDDFEAQMSDCKPSGPTSGANKGERDASWPGLDPKGERSIVTREAHIMTLSVLPGERGQGLGARLLDRLLDECKRRTAGPRINLASGSFVSDDTDTAPPRAHQDAPMRTVLEMHPSNTSAMQLYQARHFRQVAGSKGVIRHFFRGDQRIPNNIRVKIGGSDAIRMERIDLP